MTSRHECDCGVVYYNLSELYACQAANHYQGCKWTPEAHPDFCDGTYDTACGHAFTIIEGTPRDNQMRFCPFCGNGIVEVDPPEPSP